MPGHTVSVRTFEEWRAQLWPRLKQAFAETGDARYQDERERLAAVCELAVLAAGRAPLPFRIWWQRLHEQDLQTMWDQMKGAKT